MKKHPRTVEYSSPGFTIFELLVTMSIVALVGTLAVFGYQSGVKKQAISLARSQVHTLLSTARSQAILNGTDARLIINFDETDPERFLCYFGIVVRDRKAPNKWRAIHRGSTLPDGVYFVPTSKTGKVTFSNWVETTGSDRKSLYEDSSSKEAIMKLQYPLQGFIADSTGPDWICYQYDASGKLEFFDGGGGVTVAPVNELVFSKAVYDVNGVLVFEDSSMVRGIKFRSVLHSFAVDDPERL